MSELIFASVADDDTGAGLEEGCDLASGHGAATGHQHGAVAEIGKHGEQPGGHGLGGQERRIHLAGTHARTEIARWA